MIPTLWNRSDREKTEIKTMRTNLSRQTSFIHRIMNVLCWFISTQSFLTHGWQLCFRFFFMTHAHRMTHPLPDGDCIARSCTVTELTIIVTPGCKCQCLPVSWALVRIHVSTPHGCLSLQRARTAAHEHFYPCLHLKGTSVAQ